MIDLIGSCDIETVGFDISDDAYDLALYFRVTTAQSYTDLGVVVDSLSPAKADSIK